GNSEVVAESLLTDRLDIHFHLLSSSSESSYFGYKDSGNNKCCLRSKTKEVALGGQGNSNTTSPSEGARSQAGVYIIHIIYFNLK
ncbi:hypothetical protein MXD62_16980, partial [Frankia sp. Mgl5]|uniref:hypothetical protein n=1 Tax=Frankia sp. Mgl5 TaxID=2933793 RepID=UPI00200BF636